MLVEEENVLDEHEATAGGNNGEEAVEDASGHVRCEGGGASTPNQSPNTDALEEKENGQAAEVSAEPDDKETSCAEHKDITIGGVVDGVGIKMPFSRINY